MRSPKGPSVKRGPSLGSPQSNSSAGASVSKKMPRSPSPPSARAHSKAGAANCDAPRRQVQKVSSKKSVAPKKTGASLTVKKSKIHFGKQKVSCSKASASRSSGKGASVASKTSDKKEVKKGSGKKNIPSEKSSRESAVTKSFPGLAGSVSTVCAAEKSSDQKPNAKKPTTLCSTESSKATVPKTIQKRSLSTSKAASLADTQVKSGSKKVNAKSLPDDSSVLDVSRNEPYEFKPSSPKASSKKLSSHVKSLPDISHMNESLDTLKEAKASIKGASKKTTDSNEKFHKSAQSKQVKSLNRREGSASPSRKQPQTKKTPNQKVGKRESLGNDGKGKKQVQNKKLPEKIESAGKASIKQTTNKKGKRDPSCNTDTLTECDGVLDTGALNQGFKRKKKSTPDVDKYFDSSVKTDSTTSIQKLSASKSANDKKGLNLNSSGIAHPESSLKKGQPSSSPLRSVQDDDKGFTLSDDEVLVFDKKKAASKRRPAKNSSASASDSAGSNDQSKSSKGQLSCNGLVGRIVPKHISDLVESVSLHVPKKLKAVHNNSLKPKVSINHSVSIKKTKWNDTTVTKVSRKVVCEVDQKRKDSQNAGEKTSTTVLAAKEKLAEWKAMVENDGSGVNASHRKSFGSDDDDLPLQCLRKDATVVEVKNSGTDLFSSFKIDSHLSLMSRMGGSMSSVPHKKRPYAAKLESKIFGRASNDDGKRVSTKSLEENASVKKPAKDIYEFGLSSSDHGMSDSSVKKVPLEKRKRKKRESKKSPSPERANESASGSDNDSKARRMRLFGFWSGPKRHRVASLNAIAKVHCMFENENRPAFLGGYVSAKDKKDKERGKSPSLKPQRKSSRAKSKDQTRKADSSDDEASQSDEDPPSPAITTRTLRTGHGIRGAGKHWDVTVSSSSSSPQPSSSSSCSEDEGNNSDSDVDARARTSKKELKSTKTAKDQKARSKDGGSRNGSPVLKRRRSKKEPCMDLKDMVVRKRMASLNATAIMAASYSVEKRTTTTKDSTTTEEKQTTTTVVAQLPPEVRPATPSPALDDVDKAKALVKEGKRDIVVPDELIDLISSPDGRHTLILNRDDVTITGVYVRNSTHSLTHSTHAEGFCSIAGLEYRISSTSHTKTEATAVTTEVINVTPSSSEAQQASSYTPLVALSSMRPPVVLALPPHPHPHGLPYPPGQDSAFSAPHPHSHSHPHSHPLPPPQYQQGHAVDPYHPMAQPMDQAGYHQGKRTIP